VSAAAKRSTVYLEPAVHRVLRLKAAETERSISELVNEAVKLSLAEDAEDLAAFDERARERSVSFEKVVREMRRRGTL
jgi:hypothetical protein